MPPMTKRSMEFGSIMNCRCTILLIGFCLAFSVNMIRINMSINIVAMINSSAVNEEVEVKKVSCLNLLGNTTEDRQQIFEQEGEITWSPHIEGYVLGSYYVGYIATQIPLGTLIERYGCKWFLFTTTLITALCTLLIPVCSSISAVAMIILQTIRGSLQGVIPPATALIIVNWFPKMERGPCLTVMESGMAVGACLGGIISGVLCESDGRWPSSFYFCGATGLALALFILICMHENPEVHPRITKSELDFILNNQESYLLRKRPGPPWRKILKSVPIYALSYGCFGQVWATSLFAVVNSTFLGTILHYPIEQNGFLSALPFLLQFMCSIFGSWCSGCLLKKNLAGIDFLRKFFNFLSCLGFSLCLMGVYFYGCNRKLSIVFAILSAGFTGFGYAGCWIVAPDMSPIFGGCVTGLTSTFGCTSSFILSVLVGYLTDEEQTIEQWEKVFLISIGIVLSSGIVFIIFGSAEVQPWNFVAENTPKKNGKNTQNEHSMSSSGTFSEYNSSQIRKNYKMDERHK